MSREQLCTDDNADADWHVDVFVNRDLKEATKKKDPEEAGGPTRGTSHTWARDFPDSKKKNKDPEAPGGQTRGTSHTWARDFPDSKKKTRILKHLEVRPEGPRMHGLGIFPIGIKSSKDPEEPGGQIRGTSHMHMHM
jgi:hypothetical protein